MISKYQFNIIKVFLAVFSIQLLSGNANANTDNNMTYSIDSLITIKEDFLKIRESILNSMSSNKPNGTVEMLIHLYDINKRSNAQEHEFLTQSLGEMGDKKVIPILIEIANNNDLPAYIRSSAVEILSKKQVPELVDFLVEMLGDPNSRDKVNEFALDVMGDISQERMIMALLEAYQIGRNKYYSLLNTVLNGLDNFENPQIKSVYKEIAHTEDFPGKIRLKAFKGLIRFANDSEAIDEIIELLNHSNNYVYYEEIITILKESGLYDDYKDKLRQAAYKAMQNHSVPFGMKNE